MVLYQLLWVSELCGLREQEIRVFFELAKKNPDFLLYHHQIEVRTVTYVKLAVRT